MKSQRLRSHTSQFDWSRLWPDFLTEVKSYNPSIRLVRPFCVPVALNPCCREKLKIKNGFFQYSVRISFLFLMNFSLDCVFFFLKKNSVLTPGTLFWLCFFSMAADTRLDVGRKSTDFHVLMLFKNTQFCTIHFNTEKKITVDSFGAYLWSFLKNYQLMENAPRETENLVYSDTLLSGAFCI